MTQTKVFDLKAKLAGEDPTVAAIVLFTFSYVDLLPERGGYQEAIYAIKIKEARGIIDVLTKAGAIKRTPDHV